MLDHDEEMLAINDGLRKLLLERELGEYIIPSAPQPDLDLLIKSAKLGRTRRDAQEDTCSVFAAALYDILIDRKIPCEMYVVSCSFSHSPAWYHAVVKVNGRYYDSMGEFSDNIWRARAKIHPKVSFVFSYRSEPREDCYETEFEELYAFYVKLLGKVI